MSLKKILKIMIIFIIILILFDQISKILVLNLLKGDLTLISGLIWLTKVENTEFAFGINKQNIINLFLTILVLVIVIRFIVNQKENLDTKNIIALSMIIAGGISNLIDRIFRNAMINFIKVYGFSEFNFADCFIVIGWVLFVIFLFKYSLKNVKEKK